jgi:tetratricopeptide (TPR) repeat protein
VQASVDATSKGALGVPIEKWKPEQLGIHPSITVSDETSLTPYLPRNHDEGLRDRLARFRERDASSGLVLIVGTSCSGKSRTLYEAVQAQLPDWAVVAPQTDGELAALLSRGIRGGTVVWLDEVQRHLTTTQEGISAAGGIFDLLTTDRAGPVVFVGTVWTTNLAELEKRPAAAEAKTGASIIHALLKDYRVDRFRVPEGFTESELDQAIQRLDADDANDPRLRIAAMAAAEVVFDGRRSRSITQVLSGGAQLVDRMNDPTGNSPYRFSLTAKAVLQAAGDLRRAGHPNPLPRWALEDAAASYLESAVLQSLDPATWFQQALIEASQGARDDNPYTDARLLDIHHLGVPALRPKWLSAKTSGRQPSEAYEMHDYLYQDHAARVRQKPIRAALWRTLSNTENLKQMPFFVRKAIAWEAAAQGQVRAASDIGRTLERPIFTANVLIRAGAVDAAIGVLRPAAPSSPEAAMRLAQLLAQTGKIPDALLVLKPFEEMKDVARLAAELLTGVGRRHEAISILKATSSENADCALALAEIYVSTGCLVDALKVLTPWAERSPDAAVALSSLHLSSRDLEASRSVLASTAGRSAPVAVALAKLLLENGDEEAASEAMSVLIPHVSYAQASLLLTDIYVSRGEADQAIEMLAVPAQRFHHTAVRRADMLRELQRLPEALSSLDPFIERYAEARLSWCHIKLQQGCREEAMTHLGRVASRGKLGPILTAEALLSLAQATLAAGDLMTPGYLATEIWRSPTVRSRLLEEVQDRLWHWLRDPETLNRALKPVAAVSLLEFLSSMPLETSQRLHYAIVERLRDEVQGVAATYWKIKAYSECSEHVSHVLETVLEPLD